MNLHSIVRGAIETVHPDEECVLYQANGQKNTLGKITPIYHVPINVKVNLQPLDKDTLRHLERVGDTKASEQAFLYSSDEIPIYGTQRLPQVRGGDFIYRPSNNTYWLITSVIEDWSVRGWANVGIVQQITPPDFSASDWYGGGNNA